MEIFTTTIIYIASFLSIFVQVFFLFTFIEKRKSIVYRKGAMLLDDYPTVTIIVPCWNEESTIKNTTESLLAIDYPKDKIEFFLIDDGSTDSTWQVMQQYTSNPQIKIFKKENGGKHTAMNFGIEKSTSDLIGCLDADSFVDPHALKRIVSYFQKNSNTMAVAPSIIVHDPKNFLQKIQKVEYNWAVFIKKMLGLVNGIHVTPGPFSIYRREIFKTIGLFRKAHNTEDMEIAYRMQKHQMKIEQCNDAYVYTVTPDTVKKLYKQRLRWIHGFIRNTADYKDVLFKKKYGVFSMFTVPSGIISVLVATTLFMFSIYQIAVLIYHKISLWRVTGFHLPTPHVNFDWFYINTATSVFLMAILYGLLITAILLGSKMAEGRPKFSIHTIGFMVVYSIIAPFWLMNAMYNAVMKKGTKWR